MENQTLEEMLEKLVAMKTEAAPLLAGIKFLESEIKQHVKDTGEVAAVDGAEIKMRKGYTRYSWDSKALEGYALAHPDVLKLRTEKEIAPAVVIKVSI